MSENMKSEHCQAIILSSMDYGDSDRIVSLFSLEHGRLKAFAKSARNSKKRFGGSLEQGSSVDALVTVREGGLCRLEKTENCRIFTNLLRQLESMALAMYACDLIEQLTPEGHPLPRLFRLLFSLLEHLDQQTATSADRRFFEINLLNILGYRLSTEGADLKPLQDSLKTGRFGLIKFTDNELSAVGRLLDAAIASHCSRPLKSLTFLEGVL